MTKPSDELRARLRQVFMELHLEDDTIANKEEAADDFAFHMTDWLDDLTRLARFYADPSTHDAKQAKEAVAGLLYHACGHIIEAARLYDYVPDPFGDERHNQPEQRSASDGHRGAKPQK